MNIYLVIRSGSDRTKDGPNGPDTVFLVRAEDHIAAESLVVPLLELLPHKLVSTAAREIQLIGPSLDSVGEEALLLGPVYEHGINRGYKSWYRMNGKSGEPLIESGSTEDPFYGG